MELSNVPSIEEACAKDMKTGTTEANNTPMTDILPSLRADKRNVVIDFTERTTFHGVRYIAEEGCVLRR